MRPFVRHKLAMASLAVLVLLVIFAFVVPIFWKYSYEDTSSAAFLYPSFDHPLGTDRNGSDMFSMLMRGTQYSIQIALVVALLSTFVGVVLGAVAGYLGGWVDSLIMRTTDLFLVFPYVAVAAVLIHLWQGSWWTVSVVLMLLFWMQTARITRSETLSLSEREFVEAAKAAGAGPWSIIFRHLVPNMIGSITVNATLSIALAVLSEGALSFIGLGVQPPDTSLGLIVNQNYLQFVSRPWLFWGPFLVIVLISMAANFIGDGLRDAFDPRQTKVRA